MLRNGMKNIHLPLGRLVVLLLLPGVTDCRCKDDSEALDEDTSGIFLFLKLYRSVSSLCVLIESARVSVWGVEGRRLVLSERLGFLGKCSI